MAKKYRILHLFKEPENSAFVSKVLKEDGIDLELSIAGSKEKFVANLQTFRPDLVLVNDGMPSFDVKKALETFKASGLKIPFIAISDNPSVEFAVNLLKNGADDYILKDKPDQLLTAIRNALAKVENNSQNGRDLELLLSEQRKFRRLIENGADPVVVFTPEGSTSYISPAAERILGYSVEDLKQIDIKDILHPEDVRPAVNYVALCLENPGVSIGSITGRVKHKDGRWRWMEATFTNLLYDPDVKGVVNNFKDVTEKKDAERAIKESQEKYKLFFENNLDGVLLTKEEGEILAANPEACRIFGMTEEEICRVGRAGVTDPSDPRLARGIKERQLTGKARFETTMIRKDGSKFPAELITAVFKDAEGKSRNSIIVRDLSEKRKAQEELKISQKNYKVLFQHSPLPNWVYDAKTYNILDVNEAAIEHYGYSREEFMKLNIRDLRPEEEIPRLLEDIEIFNADSENVRVGRFIHQKKDGSRIKVEIYGYAIKFQNRDCRLIVCIDVTDQENIIQKLREKSAKLISAERLAKLGYWEVGLQKPYFFWSDEVYKIWGREKEQFQVDRETFEKTIHPDDLEKFREDQVRTLSGTEELDNEHRIILPDGEIKWVHEIGKLIRDEEGKPLRFEGSVQDITEYKVAIEKLRLSEARHRGILKSQTNYLTRIDLKGNYSYVNDKFYKDFSWIFPDKKVVGKWAKSSVKDYHHQKIRKVFIKCLKDPNNVYQVEMDKVRQDGGVIPTLWDFICLTDLNGDPIEVQGVGIDITDRVKAEQSLKESNTRYELVSKATSDAIWDWDLQTGHLYWGIGMQTLFGYPVDELPPTIEAWAKHVHPEEYPEVEQSLTDAIEGTENLWEAEYRFRRAEGEYSFVVERGFIIRDESGKAVRMVGAMQSIDKIKRAELEILNAYNEKETILESIGDAFFALDNEWTVTYWNQHAEKLLSCPKEKIIGENFWEVISDARNTPFSEFLKKAVFEKKIQDFEEYFKGLNRWFDVTVYPSSHNGLSVYFRDITERKESEIQILELNKNLKAHTEELVQANKGLEQFSFIVSHNLRSPVANILGLAELIGSEEYPQEIKDNFLNELLNNVQRLDNVITDLNDILQVKVEMDSRKEPVVLDDLVDSIKSSIQNLVEKEDVQITTDFAVARFQTVQSYLYSIFYNLIANSIKYRRPGVIPEIAIKSENSGENIIITFEDNGLGIDMEKKGDQVFGLYKRFHNHVEGKGMGLFLVKTQVQLLGGKISVESEVNKGTRFIIEFKNEATNLIFEDEKDTSLYSG